MLGGEIPEMIEYKCRHHKVVPMDTRLTSYHSVRDVPMQEARSLLTAHMTWAYDEFRSLGAPDYDTMKHVDSFFSHFDAVMPPKGAYFLAHDENGRAVGTGALRRVSEDTAEMKHLYVRPEMRGHRLGAAPITARIEAARKLGIRTLVADTFRGNAPMIRLYHELGFADAEPYQSAVASITPELIPHLRYFRMAL